MHDDHSPVETATIAGPPDRPGQPADPSAPLPSRRQVVRGGIGVASSAVMGGTLLSACGPDEAVGGNAALAVAIANAAGAPGPVAIAGGKAPVHPLTGFGDADWFPAFMTYDPETDPDARYFRSVVPLAPRIAPFAATQARPAMNPRPGIATLATTYRTIQRGVPDEWRRTRQAAMPQGGVQIPRFLFTNDIVVQWSGTGSIPNPAMTDVAHRNGALCLGTIFQPDARTWDGSLFPLDKVARQYVKMARYFGFDGYFVNHEFGGGDAEARCTAFIAAMRRAAAEAGVVPFHVQRYNGSTNLSVLFDGDGEGAEPAANSIMPDQGWSGYGGPGNCCSGGAINPKSTASDDIRDFPPRTPLDIYYGFQLYPGPGYLGVAGPLIISPNTGRFAFGGLQLYSMDDGYLNLMRARQSGRGADFLPAAIDIPTIERMVCSGQTGNPALDNAPSPAQKSIYDFRAYPGARYYSEWATTNDDFRKFNPDQANLPITYGVANFIVERSVIGAASFVTHFNEGEGKAFFVDGQKVGGTAWFNLGIQDILPTWQWWRAPFAGLSDRTRDAPGLLDIGFDQAFAFDGGSCLRVSGALTAATNMRVHLYKTDIPVSGGAAAPRIEVTTLGSADDRRRTSIGLIFADGQTVWLRLDTGSVAVAGSSAWVITTLDLRRFAGRRIASVLLGFEASGRGVEPVDIRFGRLAIVDGTPAVPAAPREVVLERKTVDATTGVIGVALRWTGAGRYDVFWRSAPGGARTWIGRVDGEAFYNPTALPAGTGSVAIEVQAVGIGGRGGSATVPA